MGDHYVNEAERAWLRSIADAMLEEPVVPRVRTFLIQNGLPEPVVDDLRCRGLVSVDTSRCYLTRNGLRASGHECAQRELDALAGLLALFRSRVLADGGACLWTADQICWEMPSMTRPDVLRTLCFLHGLTIHHPPHDPDTGFVLSCYIDRSILDVDIPLVTGPHREYVPPSDPAALVARYRAGEHEFPAVRIIGHPLRHGSFRQAALTLLRVNSGELVRCDLTQCDLTGAFFGYVDLSGSVFREAKLDGVTFGAGRCTQTSFEGASLIDIVVNETDFRGAYVQGAQFSSRTENLDRVLGAAKWDWVVIDGEVEHAPGRIFVAPPGAPNEDDADQTQDAAGPTRPGGGPPQSTRLQILRIGDSDRAEVQFDGHSAGHAPWTLGVRLVDFLTRHPRREFHCLDLVSWLDEIQEPTPAVEWTEEHAQARVREMGLEIRVTRGPREHWTRTCACIRRIAALRGAYAEAIEEESKATEPISGWTHGTEVEALEMILQGHHRKVGKDRTAGDPIERANQRLRKAFERARKLLGKLRADVPAYLNRGMQMSEVWVFCEAAGDDSAS